MNRLFKRDASRRRFESLFLPPSHFLLPLPLLTFCLTERVIKCKIGFLLFVCAKYIFFPFFVLSLSIVAVLVCRFGKFSNCVADRADSSLRSAPSAHILRNFSRGSFFPVAPCKNLYNAISLPTFVPSTSSSPADIHPFLGIFFRKCVSCLACAWHL